MRCTLGRCPPPRWIPGEWGQVGPCLSLTSSTTVWRLILLACLKDRVLSVETLCVGEWFVSFTPGWNTGDSNQACDACECIEAVFVFVIPRVKTGLEYVIGSSNIFLAVWSLSAPQTRPLCHFQEQGFEEDRGVEVLGSPWYDLVCSEKAAQHFTTQLTHIAERTPKSRASEIVVSTKSMACYFVGFVSNSV